VTGQQTRHGLKNPVRKVRFLVDPTIGWRRHKWRFRVDLTRSPIGVRMAGIGVRRDKAALSSGCKAHPAIRSSRKQSEQSWR
jgi:hypothetical protein